MALTTILEKVKANLIIADDTDNDLIQMYINAAMQYAEEYQHLASDYYDAQHPMSPTTEQAVIMLASHFYESRDGSTGGFFGDNVQAGAAARETVDKLLRLNREWKV